ncbi:MAG: flagellar biosynthetic protein FliR, partial [Myxococcota bacterium]
MAWEAWLPVFLALVARIAAFLQAAPLTGERQLPPRVRIGTAVLIAMAFTGLHEPMTMPALFAVLPMEILLGLIAGFSARVVIAGVEAGGEMIGLQMGLGFASTFDPALGDTALPMRRLVFALAGMAFVSAGGLDAPARLAALPTVELTTLAEAYQNLMQRGAEVMVVGVRIATPILVA